MSRIRSAAVAGSFYPASAQVLCQWLQAQMHTANGELPTPHALLLPHAGYCYSGELAAAGVSLLAPAQVSRVIIMCPAHRVPVRGVALPAPDCEAFATPLGEVPLDRGALAALAAEGMSCNELAHRDEHAIEVLLPLLQYRLDTFSLVPLVVGVCSPAWLGQRLLPLLETGSLLIASSDLSHYLSQAQARHLDHDTLARILALSPTLSGEQACGCFGLNALLWLARQQGWQPTLIGQQDSGQRFGETERVVGYGCVAFH